MPPPVFISYARTASTAHVQALAAQLGDLAFVDTEAIEDGDKFPTRILDGVLDALVVVIFATAAYYERRFCRLEMRLALAGGDATSSHLVIALGEGSSALLDTMPEAVASQSWPPAEATRRLEELVRQRLVSRLARPSRTFTKEEAQKLAAVFLEESNMPEPKSLHGILCSLPQGVAGQSIGSRFVGRIGDLRRIHQILSEGTGLRTRLIGRITAGGGFGKTRLVTEYLHRYGPRYYPGGLFWVNAASGSIDDEYWRILSALDAAVPDIATMREQGRDIRRELERALRRIDRPALYVVDNIPEAARGEDAAPIGDFCPALGAVTVLATSRQDTREEGVQTISVDTLGRNAAILLLTDNVPAGSGLPWTDWSRIAGWVGDLPLALDLLNRCLALNSLYPEDLLKRVNSPAEPASTTAELDRLREALRGQVPRDAVRGITEAFEISAEKLSDSAQVVAAILAQLAPAPIPKAFLDVLPGEWASPAVRTALHSRHFVTSGSDLSFGSMHRLMAAFLHSVTGEQLPDLLSIACAGLLLVMTEARCSDPQQWRLMNLFRPHAEALFGRLTAVKCDQARLTELGLRVAGLVSAQGDFARARRLEERVREIRMRLLGEEHPDTLTATSNLASSLKAQGDLAGARRLQEWVLEVRRRVLGEEHLATLTSMNNFASTLRMQGDYVQARQLQERALELKTRLLGEENVDTLMTMNNLALTLSEQGEYETARRLQERVLEIRRQHLGEEHPATLRAGGNLASTMQRQGDLAGARRLEEHVLEVMSRVLGEEHPHTLTAMGNLASTLGAQSDHAGARRLKERVLEVMSRVLGEEHPDTLTAMANLGVTLLEIGEYVIALPLLLKCLTGKRKVLGDHHSDTIATAKVLAHAAAEVQRRFGSEPEPDRDRGQGA
jgi:tetratricopeptide (TPR) repeat protein